MIPQIQFTEKNAHANTRKVKFPPWFLRIYHHCQSNEEDLYFETVKEKKV